MKVIIGKTYKHKNTGKRWKLVSTDVTSKIPEHWTLTIEYVPEEQLPPNRTLNYSDFCDEFSDDDSE